MASRRWKKIDRIRRRLRQDISAWIIYERCEYCGGRFPCYFALTKRVGDRPYAATIGAPTEVLEEHRQRVETDRLLGDQLAERFCSPECARKEGFRWCVVCHRELGEQRTEGGHRGFSGIGAFWLMLRGHRSEDTTPEYCSVACERNHIDRSSRRDSHEPGLWADYANCQRCGAVFPVYISLHAGSVRKLESEEGLRMRRLWSERHVVEHLVGEDMAIRYCSVQCAIHTTRATRWCKACGSRLDTRKQSSGYCSAECEESHEALLAQTRRWAWQRKYMEWKKRTGHRTDIEGGVEAQLRQLGVRYLFEEKVDRYTCDFVLPQARVVIECDGEYWHREDSHKALDADRDAALSRQGWTVLRLRGADIRRNVERALMEAMKAKGLESL